MYYVAALILEYGKMVKVITFKRTYSKSTVPSTLYMLHFVPYEVLTLFYKQSNYGKEVHITCPK